MDRMTSGRMPDRSDSERMARILDACPCGLLEVDEDGRITMANRQAEELFGYARGELLGQPVEMLLPDRHRAGHVRERRRFTAAGETRGMGSGRHVMARRRDGGEFPAEIGLTPMDAGGAATTLATIQDITQRHAEATMRERHRLELERSNADLAEFAHAASHDLKAPLRGIAHLTDWIAEDIGPGAPPQVLGNLAQLRARAVRLQNLLTGLLSYAKVGRGNAAPEPVDVAALVRDVAAALALPPGFRVEIPGPMPALRTYRLPLETVLQNLLENAVKHHDRDHGVITVTAVRGEAAGGAEGRVVFTVADDGPGIPPRFHTRIFQIFQALAPQDGQEVSGVGLAIVRRRVELNGGAIRVESAPPQRGARFIFSWADTPAG